MNNLLQETITARIEEINRIISVAEEDIKNAPNGSLRINRKGNALQYYHVENRSKPTGTYIKKRDMELVKKLAQRQYAEKILVEAYKEKKSLQDMQDKYGGNPIEKTYNKLSNPKKALISPYITPDEEFVDEWQRQEYETHFLPEEEHNTYTEKGEAVRSKSEKIIADKFYYMGIPYHYEKPLKIKGFGTLYPDFTVLNKRTRKEYYWEHFGMMDNVEYCEKVILKLTTLAREEILQGKNLILTYETFQQSLNVKMVDMLIREYLL